MPLAPDPAAAAVSGGPVRWSLAGLRHLSTASALSRCWRNARRLCPLPSACHGDRTRLLSRLHRSKLRRKAFQMLPPVSKRPSHEPRSVRRPRPESRCGCTWASPVPRVRPTVGTYRHRNLPAPAGRAVLGLEVWLQHARGHGAHCLAAAGPTGGRAPGGIVRHVFCGVSDPELTGSAEATGWWLGDAGLC